MTDVNRCDPDAWVGGTNEMPTDPTEFEWHGRNAFVACNHLVCLDCQAEVKSQLGYLLELDWEHRERVPARAVQMHTTEDWSRIDGIKTEPDFRLYTCRCFYHSASQPALTFNPERSDMTDGLNRHLPWTCAGHPPLAFPVTFGDRSIDDVAALSAAIVDASKDPAQSNLVRSVYFRSHRGALADLVPVALATAATGPAPLAPALKTLFETETRLAPLRMFTEELMRYQLGLAQPESTRRAQLVDILASASLQRPAGMSERGTLDLLRDEARQGFTTSAQLRMFEIVDPEWLVAHLEELLAISDRPGAILARAGRAMLCAAPDRKAVLQQVGALARKTGVSGATLHAQGEAALFDLAWDRDSKKVLAAIKG